MILMGKLSSEVQQLNNFQTRQLAKSPCNNHTMKSTHVNTASDTLKASAKQRYSITPKNIISLLHLNNEKYTKPTSNSFIISSMKSVVLFL
jgi:hypothetical protein